MILGAFYGVLFGEGAYRVAPLPALGGSTASTETGIAKLALVALRAVDHYLIDEGYKIAVQTPQKRPG